MSTVDKIRADWQYHQEGKANAVEGYPWGWQWGGATILEQMGAIGIGHYLRSPVLDVGCGGGKWARWLIDTYGVDVTAVDVHDVALRETKEYEPRATVLLCNGEDLEFPDGAFGSVFIFDVLLHLPQSLVMRYFQEAYRVATHSLIIALPDLGTEKGAGMFLQATLAKVWRNPFCYGYMTYYTRQQVGTMMRLAGWRPRALGHVGVSELRDLVVIGLK